MPFFKTKAQLEEATGQSHGTSINGSVDELSSHEELAWKKRSNYDLRLKTQKRLMDKDGHFNITHIHIPRKRGLYFSDIFTTMIDLKWRYVVLLYSVSFVLSWAFFGTLWWLIQKRNDGKCILEVELDDYVWTNSFLFAVETQTTIGYGGRQITAHCPEGVICLVIQCLVGFILSSSMLGLIFAKLSRPRRRADTILFSNFAVLAIRDGKMCIMFRIGDVRKSQIVEAHIRVQLFRTRYTSEGEEIPFYQQELPSSYDWEDVEDDRVFLLLPITIVHVIDKSSPFYTLSADDLNKSDFELVLILEGIVEASGQTMQARTSYLASEILWGCLFKPVVTRNAYKNSKYLVDFSRFNETVEVPTPRCSPKKFYEEKEKLVKQCIRRKDVETTPPRAPNGILKNGTSKSFKEDPNVIVTRL